jgi:hypothetical protein
MDGLTHLEALIELQDGDMQVVIVVLDPSNFNFHGITPSGEL